MKRGRWLEPAVAEAVKEENPEWAPLIHKNDSYFRLPDLRLGSTPDYFIGDQGAPATGVLECKSMLPERFADYGEAAPLFQTLQVLVQMMTTGAAWGTIACMVMTRNLDLHLYAVPRHAAAEAKIAEAVAKFWEAVERGDQPPPVMPQDRKTLAEMFRTDNGETLDLSGDNALPELLEERRALRATTKTAEHRVAEIEDEVRMKMGAAAVATLPGYRITYKTQHRKETVIPARDIRVLRIAQKGQEANGQ